ncbi:hypothetical protein V495_02913 [Pseudogymnoascus sp. VKM F-4514 (FW-929)]|nr:hypothetical protein V495_02913 [Pseudogymnoascus sp. VKM F-4514 (FW-929)]
MPLFGGHHRSSSSTASSAHQNAPGATSNLLQAAQVLGSVGTPSASTRTTAAATATAPGAPPARLYPSSPTASHTFNAAAQPAAQPPNHSPAQTNLPSNAIMSNPAAPNSAQQFETPRRQQAYARHPDELHMGDADSAAAQKGPLSPRDYGAAGAPRINLEQATPETANYGRRGQRGGAEGPPLTTRLRSRRCTAYKSRAGHARDRKLPEQPPWPSPERRILPQGADSVLEQHPRRARAADHDACRPVRDAASLEPEPLAQLLAV